MEIIVIVAMIVALALCLGADIMIVPIMLMAFIELVLLFILVFFIRSAIRLGGTKRTTGQFMRFGRAEDKSFDTAFNRVGNNDLSNAFPREIIMRSKIYIPEKNYQLRYDSRRNEVYDFDAVCCIFLGLFFSGLSFIVMTLFLTNFLGVV